MNKVIRVMMVIFIFTMMTGTHLTYANWKNTFTDTYIDLGIDDAVVFALKDGISPYFILKEGLVFDGLNPVNIIKALYCAGAKGEDIGKAAKRLEIDSLVLTSGYRKYIVECSEGMADSQAFTSGSKTGFVSLDGSGGGTVASPSGFTQ